MSNFTSNPLSAHFFSLVFSPTQGEHIFLLNGGLEAGQKTLPPIFSLSLPPPPSKKKPNTLLSFFSLLFSLPFYHFNSKFISLEGWKSGRIKNMERIEKFQFSLMAFDLGVETWRDRKCSLNKFIFIPLLDKKSNKLEKKKKKHR